MSSSLRPLYVPAGSADAPRPRTADDESWERVANDIANQMADARTPAELDEVRSKNLDRLKALTAARRDLALILSAGFADRRIQLGRV